MIANKEEIRVGQVIVHILDSTVGMPVLSDTVLDYGSDFADFIKAHIFKTDNSDDIRRCVFEEESAIYSYLQEWNSENFVDFSKKIAEELDLEFYFTNSIQQEYKITGFIDAGGKYHETEFYKAFKNGGLFFLDELDASIPEYLILYNS